MIATSEEHRVARDALLVREKALTRLRDELAEERRRLPWVPVEEAYRFQGPAGERTLLELFHGRGQLLVYHFMFGPTWDEGCPSCSFWADGLDGVGVHLAQRDVTFVCVSRAPYDKLAAYRERMRWSFPWFSSAPSSFNEDVGVTTPAGGEIPGISAFARAGDAVLHTYFTTSRGLDAINPAYQLLDLTPKGRNEGALEWPMAWLRRHDAYHPG